MADASLMAVDMVGLIRTLLIRAGLRGVSGKNEARVNHVRSSEIRIVNEDKLFNI